MSSPRHHCVSYLLYEVSSHVVDHLADSVFKGNMEEFAVYIPQLNVKSAIAKMAEKVKQQYKVCLQKEMCKPK